MESIHVGGLIFDSAGNLYGTTSAGGSGGGGTVFELSPSGDTWTFKLLYSFSGPIVRWSGCDSHHGWSGQSLWHHEWTAYTTAVAFSG